MQINININLPSHGYRRNHFETPPLTQRTGTTAGVSEPFRAKFTHASMTECKPKATVNLIMATVARAHLEGGDEVGGGAGGELVEALALFHNDGGWKRPRAEGGRHRHRRPRTHILGNPFYWRHQPFQLLHWLSSSKCFGSPLRNWQKRIRPR
jgi:hypothetical protein